MSKFDRDYGYGLKQNKNDKTLQEEKKKLLQSKFSNLSSISYSSETKTKEEPKEKVIKETSSKQLEKINELKLNLKKQIDKSNQLKKTTFEQRKIIDNHVNEITSLQKQLNEDDKKIESLKMELKSFETASKKINRFANENKDLKDRIQTFRILIYQLVNEYEKMQKEQTLDGLKETINELKGKIAGHRKEISAFQKQINNLNSQITTNALEYEQEINRLEQIIKNDNSLSIKEIITTLRLKLNDDNYHDYDEICNIFWELNRLKNKHKGKKIRNIEIIPRHSIYGYIVLRNGYYYFSSVEGEIFLISCCRQSLKQELLEDYPAKASIIDKSFARIEDVYIDNIEIVPKKYVAQNIEKINSINETIDKQIIIFDKPYKILIVGSRSKNAYINKLESHGLEVIWHDPYEEHESRLKDKFSYVDVVIICTSHTSHSAIGTINKYDEKVELIRRDNVDTIFHRTRYALIRLGLLKTGEENIVV